MTYDGTTVKVRTADWGADEQTRRAPSNLAFQVSAAGTEPGPAALDT
jgi:hypothetical protein